MTDNIKTLEKKLAELTGENTINRDIKKRDNKPFDKKKFIKLAAEVKKIFEEERSHANSHCNYL